MEYMVSYRRTVSIVFFPETILEIQT
uniref:Uncharacterized protein n=1 Tax=Lepeophtheirus salmonis TaxID=72036 RepID=A0A0K2T2N7_LEPSM